MPGRRPDGSRTVSSSDPAFVGRGRKVGRGGVRVVGGSYVSCVGVGGGGKLARLVVLLLPFKRIVFL